MSLTNYNTDPNNQAKRLSVKYALELLNEGSRLTKRGKDLDTISKEGENYLYNGLNDTKPTILNEKEVSELIKGHNWIIDLF